MTMFAVRQIQWVTPKWWASPSIRCPVCNSQPCYIIPWLSLPRSEEDSSWDRPPTAGVLGFGRIKFSMNTMQPNKKHWWSTPQRKLNLSVWDLFSDKRSFLYYVCPICTLIIRNAWRVGECGPGTHSPARGCSQRPSQRKLSLWATRAVTTYEYRTLQTRRHPAALIIITSPISLRSHE